MSPGEVIAPGEDVQSEGGKVHYRSMLLTVTQDIKRT